MRLLSATATSRLAEQLLHEAGGELTHDGLVARLEDCEVARDRAVAAIGQALILGRLQALESQNGPLLRVRPVVTRPTPTKEASS